MYTIGMNMEHPSFVEELFDLELRIKEDLCDYGAPVTIIFEKEDFTIHKEVCTMGNIESIMSTLKHLASKLDFDQVSLIREKPMIPICPECRKTVNIVAVKFEEVFQVENEILVSGNQYVSDKKMFFCKHCSKFISPTGE